MNPTRFLIALSALLGAAATVRAQSFTYTTENSKTTITGFSAEPSGAVTVPATLGGYTVTEIGRSAFKDRTAITSVSFASGASVTRIGAGAFQGCSALQSIALPTGTASLPQCVLQGCAALTSVTIPSTVTSIGPMAFSGCEALASLTLPSALTSIGESALSGCKSLAALTIPAGVTAIPAQLCNECRGLGAVTFGGSVTTIGDNAFHNCAALTVCIPPGTVSSLGAGAFSGCSSLTSIALGSSLASIGDGAFRGCETLANITVAAGNPVYASLNGVLFNAAKTTLILCPPAKAGAYAIPASVTSLGAGAFAHCSGLTGITLPSGLTAIPDDAFYYATGLTAAPLTANVTSIGAWACAGLKSLTSITLPASAASLGDDAFHSASALKWAIFAGNAPGTLGSEPFKATADDFTVFYYGGTSGFTSPLWFGYPAVELGISPPLVAWLSNQGLPPDTGILTDSNHDGVSLLLAYALGLNPANDLSGSLPKPVLSNGTLSLTFQGNSDGIIYGAETSTDLSAWTSAGVTVSAPDAQGERTVSIPVGAGARFLRLAVQPSP